MILSHIAALAKNRVIGAANSLPWQIPEDLKYFKDQTRGKILIMGRKTFESLPGILPKRFHLVISRTPQKNASDLVRFVASLEEAIAEAKNLIPPWPQEVFIVGGGEIYRQSLAIADKLYLTEIDREFSGDTFYPEVRYEDFQLISERKSAEPIPHRYLIYQRR